MLEGEASFVLLRRFTVVTPRQIKQHIAGHAFWKVRLREALSTGAAGLDATTIRPDDRCDFGKWLHSLPDGVRTSLEARAVADAHRQFHQAAADVVVQIQGGDRKGAEDAMRLRGSFSRTTAHLTGAMAKWMEKNRA
jgi:hypothetical protein